MSMFASTCTGTAVEELRRVLEEFKLYEDCVAAAIPTIEGAIPQDVFVKQLDAIGLRSRVKEMA